MSEKRRILYIEDDAKARHLVNKVLSRDFEVMTASNGLEGLDILQKSLPDLVLTDINLPDLSGEVIAARIRAFASPDLPIVAISASADKQTRDRALAAGCIGMITKPIDTRSLVATIQEFLGGRTDSIDDATARRATQEFQVSLTGQLEKTVRKLQEDNAELRNLESAKTAFLTQVSHELRTPLTVLSGYIQMLRQELHNDPNANATWRELADMAYDGWKRLHKLMNEIVVMARLSANQIEPTISLASPGSLIGDVISEYAEAMQRRNIELVKVGNGWGILVNLDSTLVRMAIDNLVSNAIKFTPDGGRVAMCLEEIEDNLHFAIEDTGVGIAQDHLPLLFKPFYTSIDVSRGRTSKTDFMGMGIGLGLTIVTKIVQAHEGRLWAESPGYDEESFPGSTFHILIPMSGLATKPRTAVARAML